MGIWWGYGGDKVRVGRDKDTEKACFTTCFKQKRHLRLAYMKKKQ